MFELCCGALELAGRSVGCQYHLQASQGITEAFLKTKDQSINQSENQSFHFVQVLSFVKVKNVVIFLLLNLLLHSSNRFLNTCKVG